MRDTIFISHANPEDNNFSIWLDSRLNLLGYKVWIDKTAMLGGEKIWEDIDQVIRHNTIKYLLVYSNNICFNNQPGKLKDGIYKEFSLAESISKQEALKDFIILLKIDDSSHSLFIGADRLMQIPFQNNWANGFGQLVSKFEKDKINKTVDNHDRGFSNWFEREFIIKNNIISKRELYYSNWWPINELPECFYMYHFETEQQAWLLYERNNLYPVGKISNVLSSFDPDFSFDVKVEGQRYTFNPKVIDKIKVSDINLLINKDKINHFKYLLKRIFHQIMKNRGMSHYKMINKNSAYYFTPANLPSSKVSFTYSFQKYKKLKTKWLIGDYLSLGKWHFAVSCRSITLPIFGFSLKNHIVFTLDGFKTWDDKDKMHTHRRKKGKRFFNEQWRDLLIAFLHALGNQEMKIELPLNKQFTLRMIPWPHHSLSDFGYFEPKNKNRQDILIPDEDYLEEEVYFENEHIE